VKGGALSDFRLAEDSGSSAEIRADSQSL